MTESELVTANDGEIHPEAAVAPGYLANHAAKAFNRTVDAELRPLGITLALVGPVMLLSCRGPMLQRDIVRHSAVKQPAMVALLDKLEAQGLITRARVPGDGRAFMVHLTPEGQILAERSRDVLLTVNSAGMRGFTPADATLLVTLLQRFIKNIEPES